MGRTYNIAKDIKRIKNDIKDSYNIIAAAATKRPTTMPNVRNISSLPNTIRNMYFGVNHIKERSNNGYNYDYLFHSFDNEVLDLDDLKTSNVISAENMFLNAVNLSDQSVENIINWIPNYSQLENPYINTLEYFGLDQNLRDNISEELSTNNVAPKGWRVRDYYNYILAYTTRNPDPNIPDDTPEITEKFFQESAENGWQKRGTIVVNQTTGETRLVENNANWIREQLKNIHPVILNLDGTAGTKDFSKMFAHIVSLKEIHGLDISNAENIYMMFENTRLNTINSIDNCNLNTSKVVNAAYAFYDSGLNSEKMVFNLSNCTNVYNMFGTSGMAPVNIKEIELHNTQNVKNWSYFGWGSSGIQKITGVDLSGTTSGYRAFDGLWGVKEIEIEPNSTRNLITTTYMFNQCRNVVNFPNFLTNNVTNAAYMFNGCSNINNIPSYNFINLENADYMFNGAGMTTIPSFIFNNVYTMTYMFNQASKFNQLPVINTDNVLYFTGAFQGCRNLKTIPNINTNRGTYFAYMFNDCTNLTNIANINLNRGQNFYNFFTNCYNLTTINQVYNFNNATNMACMFNQCYNLTLSSLNNIVNMLPNADKFANDVYFEDMHQNRLGYFGILNWYLAEICNKSTGDVIRNKGYNLTNNVRDLTLKYIYNYNTVSNATINQVEVFETFANHTEDINIGMLNNSFNDLPRDSVKYLNMVYIGDTSNIPSLARNMINLVEVPNIHRIEMMFRVDSAFQNCTNLTTVSNINLFNCISASYMFDNCQNLTTLNNFTANQPRKLRRMSTVSGMFRNCRKLGNLDLDLIDFYAASSADEVFANCISMNNFDNIRIGQGSSGTMNRAFADIPNLTTLNNVMLNGWYGTTNIFQNDINLTNITNSIINTGYCGNYAFAGLTNLKNLENTKIYAGNNSIGMFKNCSNITSFENILLSTGSSTTNGRHAFMFEGCSNLQTGIFAFTGSNNVASAYANCTNMTDVTRIDMSSAYNILNIFYGVNKLTNNALYNIINALPRYENVRGANGGHGATLEHLGINNSRDINIPWGIASSARSKGWLLGDIAHTITGNYVNGGSYIYNVYDAPDHKDTSINGQFIREALIDNAKYIQDIQSITINNTNNIQDWSKFFQSSSENSKQWTSLQTINANMNNITNGQMLFWNCSNLENIGNHYFNNIDNATMMFGYTRKINQKLNIDFRTITNTSRMFESATGTATFDQGGYLNIVNSINANAMFAKSNLANRFDGLYAPNCTTFDNIYANSNIEYLNTLVINNATSTNYFAYNAKYLKRVGDIKLDKHLLSPLFQGFYNCPNLISVGNFNSPNGGTAYDYVFQNCLNLTTIGNVTWPIASRLLDTFANDTKLQDFNLIAPLAKDLYNTFWNCTNITKISEILQGMPNIVNMQNAFYNTGITNLTNVSLPNCNNLYRAFADCKNLQTIDGLKLGRFPQSYAFNNCTNLISVNNFQANASSLSQLFQYCTNLQYVNNSDFTKDTTAGNATSTFGQCTNLKGLYNVKLNFQGSFGTPFSGTPNLTEIEDCEFRFTDMAAQGLKNIINTKLNYLVPAAFDYFKNNPNLIQVKNIIWNTANILNTQNGNTTNSYELFRNDANLTDIDIDIENISNLSNYFLNCNKLVNINLRNVKSNAVLTFAFSNTGITNLNILNNILPITTFTGIFQNCSQLSDISAWQNRALGSGMFNNCPLITDTPNNISLASVSFNQCPNIVNVLPLKINSGTNVVLFPHSNNLTEASLDNIANGLYNYKIYDNGHTALKNNITNILTMPQINNLSDYAKETMARKYWIIPGYTANTIFTGDNNETFNYALMRDGIPATLGAFNIWTQMNITFFNGVTSMNNWCRKSTTISTLSLDSCENVQDINGTLRQFPALTNLSGFNNLGKAFTNDTTVMSRTLELAASINLTPASVNNLANAIAYVRPESHINLHSNVMNLVDINTKRLINYKGWTLDGYTQNVPAKVIDLVTNREVFNLKTKDGGWLPAIDSNGIVYLHSVTKRDGSYDEMTLTITNRIGNTLNLVLNSTSEKNYDYLLINKGTTTVYNGYSKDHANTPISVTDLNVGDVLTFNYRKDGSASNGIDEYQIYFEQDLIKLDPIYTKPTGLQIYAGEKLSTVTLPDSHMSWKDPNNIVPGTNSDNNGSTSRIVIYTPDDTITYNTVEFTVSIQVIKRETTLNVSATKTNINVGETTTISSTSNGDGAITYSVNDTTKAIINSTTGVLTAAAAGTVTVTASQASGAKYKSATKTIQITINEPTE